MPEILILDIETTGFLKQGGSIVEIGIVSLNLNNGEILEIYNSTVREDRLNAKHREHPMGWIFNNSSLTVEDVRNAPTEHEVFPEVQEIIDSYPYGVTAYNNVFDFGFMEDRGFKFPRKLLCPMKLSTPICKIPKGFNRGNYKWPSVEEAFKFFFPESNYIEEHRGADDAKHEAMIVYELYKMGVFKIDG